VKFSISRHRYEDQTHETQAKIHELARSINASVKYDYEFDFYKVITTEADWLMATLKDPDTASLFRIYS
jgi:uncharacterized FlaG/YvyC family protein